MIGIHPTRDIPIIMNQVIVDLVKDFTRDEPDLRGPGQGKWLQDDYVKFLRFGKFVLEPANLGILAMITNHRYLTNRTFKGMRNIWSSFFRNIRILDLHGNRVVDEVSPLGHDENVFDIEQGVAIGFFSRGIIGTSSCAYQELCSRTTPSHDGKYDVLAIHQLLDRWCPLYPTAPNWIYRPTLEVGEDIEFRIPELGQYD